MRVLPITLLAVAALAFTAAQAGDVYRWTDAKGVTHFADAPPRDIKYERVNARTGSTSAAVDPAELAAASAAVEEEAAKAEAIAARAERCRIAKYNLKNLSAGVAMIPDEDGQARHLTAEEQARQTDLNERAITENCTTPQN